jgi:hypothetical protein
MLSSFKNHNVKIIMLMKNAHYAKVLVVGLAGLMMSTLLSAQSDKSARPSPPMTAKGKVGPATITIDYSSPSVKGRKIWGALVPYGAVWRAGANEATLFQTDKDIKIEGKSLPAGKYSLFATPGETEWAIIFNSETGQWGDKKNGDANLDPAKNVLTVKVKPVKSAGMNEKLVYAVTGNGFALRWENLEVPVGIK